MALVALSVVEQRLDAVRAVLSGAKVTEVAVAMGVSRQSVHSWIIRYLAEGLAGLALVRSAQEFQELQTAYLVLRQLAHTSPDQRGDPVLYWPALVPVDRAVRTLGEAAGVEQAQLDQ